MISSLILSSLMFLIIAFFVVIMNGCSAASVIYGAFLLFLFVRMSFAEHKKVEAELFTEESFRQFLL